MQEASKAGQMLERALELDENNPGAHEIQGHCLLRFGDKEGARKSYERAIELAEASEKEAYRANLKRL